MAAGQADWTSKSDVNITNVSIAVTGNVVATVSGSVSIIGTPNVTISGTPAVTITSGTVNAAVTGNVSITGTPTVEITSGSVTATVTGTVAISGTPSVTITSGTINATVTGSVDITSGSVTIASGNVVVTGDVFTTGSNTEQHKIAVTDAVTTQAWTNAIKSFMFYNDGPFPVHFRFGADPTTDYFKVPSGNAFTIDIASQNSRFICDTGETATVFAIGMY